MIYHKKPFYCLLLPLVFGPGEKGEVKKGEMSSMPDENEIKSARQAKYDEIERFQNLRPKNYSMLHKPYFMELKDKKQGNITKEGKNDEREQKPKPKPKGRPKGAKDKHPRHRRTRRELNQVFDDLSAN